MLASRPLAASNCSDSVSCPSESSVTEEDRVSFGLEVGWCWGCWRCECDVGAVCEV